MQARLVKTKTSTGAFAFEQLTQFIVVVIVGVTDF
jgi:hypothetical protein